MNEVIWPDIINGCFELFGAPFILMSFFKLIRDKKVRGVNWCHVTFFTVWGLWNLFYYPSLNQRCSFIGGVGIVITNTVWLIAILYYIHKENNE